MKKCFFPFGMSPRLKPGGAEASPGLASQLSERRDVLFKTLNSAIHNLSFVGF